MGAFGLAMLGLQCRAGETASSKPVGVVELFTSQGCSSCPKADAAFARLADRRDIIAISYHVDYWNYLGWQDTLSARENTERQYGYSKSFGASNVFTPQIVLNGVRTAKTSGLDHVMTDFDALARGGQAVSVPVSASLTPEAMTVAIGAGSGKANVVVAYFKRSTTVSIESGENTGKTLHYRNAVTKLETVGVWDGKPMTLKLPASLGSKPGYDGCAILLQAHDADGNPGRIYGAAAL
jgi:hypothetical protein